MLIVDELLLLLLDDETGKLTADGLTSVDPVLGGAVLVDLALGGFVGLSSEGEPVKPGRVVVRRPGPTGDPLLDDILQRVSESSVKPAKMLTKITKGLRAVVLQRLVDLGAVRSEKAKVLGIFPTSRWPESDPRPELLVRDRLVQVLVEGRQPDERTAALISLLLTAKSLTKVVRTDRTGVAVDKKALTARAKEIADSDWASAAARQVVRDLQAAMMIAVMVPVMTAGAGS